MIYLRLFFEFFKTGLFAIGGGLATIPFLNEMGLKTGWFTTADLTNMIAISESTPGPTGINMATYVGYTVAGIPGSFIATIGIVTPSIIIIILISKAISKYKDNPYVKNAMVGIRACSIALILYAVLSVISNTLIDINAYKTSKNILSLFDIKVLCLFIGILFLSQKFKKIHPALFLLVSAIIGIIIF